MMDSLPDEIWTEILDYLDPLDIVSTQSVSSHLLKVGRDSRLWRYKCFEKAPSAAQSRIGRVNEVSALVGALGSLSLDIERPIADTTCENTPHLSASSKRTKAVAKWDSSGPDERVDWYSEYIGRHAPLSVEWEQRPVGSPDVKGMALYRGGEKIVGPLENGSLGVWNVERAINQRPELKEVSRSSSGLLFQDLKSSAGPSTTKEPSLGYATDNITLNSAQNKAYVAAGDFLSEVDLEYEAIVSQQKYAWPITALSQENSNHGFQLTVGTSWSLHIHDPRLPLGNPSSPVDYSTKVDGSEVDPTIAFLPKYSKLKSMHHSSNLNEERDYFSRVPRGGLRAFARVDPGPQSILNRGDNEIIIAGRMPSILFYDRRAFPKLQSTIHSGGRLASLTTLPFAPVGANRPSSNSHTLIAGGEYGGCGSLEIYELPHQTDIPLLSKQSTFSTTDPSNIPLNPSSSSPLLTDLSQDNNNFQPYAYRNRQTTSSAKVLSVCTHGTRILFSDADGQLKWTERDAHGLSRRWNINAAHYDYHLPILNPFSTSITASLNPPGTGTGSNDVVRKMTILPSPHLAETTKGDDDILIWTGEKLAIVTLKSPVLPSWDPDDLASTFERKMDLNAPSTGSALDGANVEREREYVIQMRRALERQADERRWMSRFGGRWR